ncbi:hypothetical protein Pmar_PMAR001178 [Perkinsus marinus ATCC 50983]|uniref:Uncharacterized protein n=1 Tax=Perkinsus marinus (strain ATCC 50983 / TXsc) TaxID=423536 RepID=C5KT29_PERM5|nr:hypothetical protein Pmar_PMAR001178 [Perkinsus marinus ATCC 50983]EER12379.1 hypothetical protein Pmar_PMAR001178 [Perkinsus marinus ATCC 50983]|eukprot:XP_002780584.1 hypothetical protein Pmar_PMAR001178 [Perkinsus marinus ATCC 50983]
MSASGQRENFLPPEGVWEVVRKEEVEYEDGVPQSDKPVMTSSPVSLQPGSSAAHGSPGAVVSRRVVRYASPVRSRVTTTTYRCSPESPRPRSDARASAAMATNILPSYETSRRVIYTPRKEEMARSGSSYPMSCKKTILREMEESAPEPAPNSPQTARASPCDAPAGRRLLAYYEDEEEEDGIENIEMEADPSKPTARYKRAAASKETVVSSYKASRLAELNLIRSVKKPPTPLTAIQTQTEDLDQEDEPPREVGDSGGLGSLGKT